ncbi:hypothetical protein LJC38_01980 [Parabacteroides sp. OttesenSCG-928-K15]|nr:hypothetical protein [Parabacteroides sp. OttesenSCG-928-K15]
MTHKFKQFNSKVGLLLALCFMLFMHTSCDENDPSVSASFEEMFISAEAANIPLTIQANCNWSANSDAEWLHLSQKNGRGTTDISLMVETLVSDKSRTASVTVIAENGNKTVIKITQNGLAETGIRISPKTITVGAKASYGNHFGVVTQYSDAVVSATITSGESWIKELKPTTNIDGYVKNVLYTFTAEENVDAVERVGKITVTVTFANQEHKEDITVIQNGLGVPTLSTQERIYLAHSQTSHTQYLWIEDGDQTNVSYKCTFTSNQSGTGSEATPWIQSATVTDGVLHLTTLANDYDEVREGEVMVVASRNQASTKVNIHVIQAGHRSAGANIPNSLLAHNHKGATYQLPLNPINNSKIKVVANNAVGKWVKDVKVNETGVLSYTLDLYDGSMGSYREATLTLEASNGHNNVVYYSVTIRQYAPESASISLPVTMMSHNSAAQTGVMPVNANYASKVKIVNVSQTWVSDVKLVGSELVYSISSYDGSAGDYREAVITLSATNDHANAAYYYVTIRQYAPLAAGMNNATKIVTFNAGGTSDKNIYANALTSLPLNAINGATLTLESVSEDWVHVDGLKLKSTLNNAMNYTLTYGVDKFDGREGNVREAVITIKASNGHVNDAYYYIVVRQYAPLTAGISDMPELLEHAYNNNVYAFVFNALNSSKIELHSIHDLGYGTDWISLDVKPYEDNPNNAGENRTYVLKYALEDFLGDMKGNYREVRLMFSATNEHNNEAMYYVTVRQYAPEAAGITIDKKTITINSIKQLGYVVYTTLNGSELVDTFVEYERTIVENGTPNDWLYISKNAEKDESGAYFVEYEADAFDGSTGEFREAHIYLVVKNAHADRMLYKVTVRQMSPNAAGLSISEERINISHLAMGSETVEGYILPYKPINGSKIQYAVSTSAWVKIKSWDDGIIEYHVDAFAGGQEGDFRDARIEITVTNSHSNPITYSVPIRQYAPKAAGLSIDQQLMVINNETQPGRLFYTLLNYSEIVEATVEHQGLDNWLTITDPNGLDENKPYIAFQALEYNGEQGAFREAYIYLLIKNAHVDKMLYKVTIRQMSPNAAGLSISEERVHVGHEAMGAETVEGYILPYKLLNGSKITSVVTRSNWLTVKDWDSDRIEYHVKAYDGSEGDFREERILITVSNSHINEIIYSVPVRQYAPKAAGLSIDNQLTTINSEKQPGRLFYTLLNNSEIIEASVDHQGYDEWLKITDTNGSDGNKSYVAYMADAYDGSKGAFREAYIYLTTKNAHADRILYKVTIRQMSPNAAGLSISEERVHVGHEAMGAETVEGYILPYKLLNGSKITSVVTRSNWLTVKDWDSDRIEYHVKAYDGSEGDFREDRILITVSNSHINEIIYSVPVRQYAPKAAALSIDTKLVTIGNERQPGRLFYTLLNNSEIVEASVEHQDVDEWLKITDTNGSDENKPYIAFEALEYNGEKGAFREAYIYLLAKNAHADRMLYKVTIRQMSPNAAGMSISETRVHVGHQAMPTAPATAGYTISYTLLNKSTIKSVTSSNGWLKIKDSKDGNIEYTVDAFDGNTGDFRDAAIEILVSNSHMNEIRYTVPVRQHAPKAAALSIDNQLAAIDSESQPGRLFYTLLNNSEIVEASVDHQGFDEWLTITDANGSDGSKHYVAYQADAYDGSKGGFREAYIYLTAKNAHADRMLYKVTIRQMSPDAAGMSISETRVHVGHQAMPTAPATAGYTISYTLLNKSTIKSVTSSNSNWLKIKDSKDGNIEYTVDAFDGNTGDFRDAAIEILVSNSHMNEIRYTVPVRQHAPKAAALSIDNQLVTIKSEQQPGRLFYTLLNNSVLLDATVEHQGTDNWITITNKSGSEGGIPFVAYDAEAYDGSKGATREAYIYLLAKNAHVDEMLYKVTISQSAPGEAGISLATERVELTSTAKTGQEISFSLQNGSSIKEIKVSQDKYAGNDWLTITHPDAFPYIGSSITFDVKAFDGTGSDYRDAVITLTVANGNSNVITKAVTVRQLAPQEAGISMPPMFVTHHSTATDGGTGILPLNLLNTSKVKVINFTNDIFKDAPAVYDNLLYYTLAPFTGTTGTSRQSIITLEASNAHANAATYTVTVVQYAASNKVGLTSLPTYLGLGYSPVDDFSLPLNFIEGSSLVAGDVSFQSTAGEATWISDFKVNGPLLTFDVKANNTGEVREGYLALTVKNTTAGTSAIYYVNLRQHTSQAPVVPANIIIKDEEALFDSPLNKTYSETYKLQNIPAGAELSAEWFQNSVCVFTKNETVSVTNNGTLKVDFEVATNTDNFSDHANDLLTGMPHLIGRIMVKIKTTEDELLIYTLNVFLELN